MLQQFKFMYVEIQMMFHSFNISNFDIVMNRVNEIEFSKFLFFDQKIKKII